MSRCRFRYLSFFCCVILFSTGESVQALPLQAELILHGGNVITVEGEITTARPSAVAVAEGLILAVGDDQSILKLRGEHTEVIDLQGATVLPGLIDSHTHPISASLHEFDHPIPEMKNISDVLDYVRNRAEVLEDGEWIVVQQVFITRLAERRYPTKAELDNAAPHNPVHFSTGPDSSVNSLALTLSGIDRDFQSGDPSATIEKNPTTGEPTGILRNASKFLKRTGTQKVPSQEERDTRLIELFDDYNSVGITGICDRNAGLAAMEQYQRLLAAERLHVRIAASRSVGNSGPVELLVESIRAIGREPLVAGGPMLRIVGIKCFLDGGMLTGSAAMREPWGISSIYSISDPAYRGMLYIQPDVLVPMVKAAVESRLQFTAHSVGDGAVHALLSAYEEVNQSLSVAHTRPCLTHSNFMSRESIAQAARLGVLADIQPAWLWLDGQTLLLQFGEARLRYFQPLQSLFEAGVTVGGGSDHMQKIGSLRSVNPYNPFLGMWIAITRTPQGQTTALHPEESLSRAAALRLYTINNARFMFLENTIGSIEKGKFADLVIVDRDPLTCPIDDLPKTQVLTTFLAGKVVYQITSPLDASDETGVP
ncbi:MAG: amidohydrolase [Planctomycetaceae bacterium]|nr:MAG: amidohydrolase [Planctomycetaceae bacterium]